MTQRAPVSLWRENTRLKRIIELQTNLTRSSIASRNVLEHAVRGLAELTGADAAIIELLQPDGRSLRVKTIYAPGFGSIPRGFVLKLDNSFTGIVVQTGRTMRCDDCAKDDRCNQAIVAATGIRSAVVTPLINKGVTIGVLKLAANSPFRFGAEDEEALTLISPHISATISNYLRRQRQQQMEIYQRKAENQLRQEHAFNQAILDSLTTMRNGMIVIRNKRLTYVNDTICEWLDYSRAELLSMTSFISIFSEDQRQNISDNHRRRVAGEKFEQLYETALRRRDGERIDVDITVNTMRIEGAPHVICLFRDITERKRNEERLRRMAEYDELTGLPNRALFLDRLKHALERSQRFNTPLAMLFLDLNGFKDINDQYGHLVGDELLRQFADRLRQCLRDADTAARLGGDEFTVILEAGNNELLQPKIVAEKILAATHQPFQIDAYEIPTSPSIGIAMDIAGVDDMDELLSRADHAMYHAKKTGVGIHQALPRKLGRHAV